MGTEGGKGAACIDVGTGGGRSRRTEGLWIVSVSRCVRVRIGLIIRGNFRVDHSSHVRVQPHILGSVLVQKECQVAIIQVRMELIELEFDIRYRSSAVRKLIQAGSVTTERSLKTFSAQVTEQSAFTWRGK